MLKRLLLLPVLLVLWPLVALAQEAGVLPDPADIQAFATLLLQAASSKNWSLVLALALSGVVFALKRWGHKIPAYAKLSPFFKTPAGTALLTLLASFAAALITGLAAPGVTLAMAPTVALTAFVLALKAGGWGLLGHLLALIPAFSKLAPTKAEVVKFEPAPAVAPVKSDDIANGP